MKKSIFKIALSVFAVASITSCTSSADKLKDAEEKVIESNNELQSANDEYVSEIEAYRIETAKKIEENNRSIAAFNLRVEGEKKEAKAQYKKDIAALEQKNSDMQKKLDEYKAEGKEGWETFKAEFNHDMEELGRAFSGLTEKSKK